MLAKVCSAAVNGIEAYPVEVEVNAGYGDTIIVMIDTDHTHIKRAHFCGVFVICEVVSGSPERSVFGFLLHCGFGVNRCPERSISTKPRNPW